MTLLRDVAGGAADTEPMNGKADLMNVIEEVSDDQSSDDEFYPVGPVNLT